MITGLERNGTINPGLERSGTKRSGRALPDFPTRAYIMFALRISLSHHHRPAKLGF